MKYRLLNHNDREFLKAQKKPSSNSILLFVIFEIALIVSLLILSLLIKSEVFYYFKIQWSLPGFGILIYLIYIRIANARLRKDLRTEKKNIIISNVKAKKKEKKGEYQYTGMNPDINFHYYIYFQKFIAEVNEQQYERIKVGDKIEAEIAPCSKFVLNIMQIDN